MTETTPSLSTWAKQVHTVFGAPSLVAIPFALSAPFASFIREQSIGFPLLYLHGEPASGKSAMGRALMALGGDTPQAVVLSMSEAEVLRNLNRAFADMPHRVVVADEFSRRDDLVSERLKMAWNGIGHCYGVNLMGEYAVVDSKPFHGALVVCGNIMPHDDALLSRMLVLEMPRHARHSTNQKSAFRELNTLLDQLPVKTAWLEAFRPHFVRDFAMLLSKAEQVMAGRTSPFLTARMRRNAAVLYAITLFWADRIALPFSTEHHLDYLVAATTAQWGQMCARCN